MSSASQHICIPAHKTLVHDEQVVQRVLNGEEVRVKSGTPPCGVKSTTCMLITLQYQ